MYFFPFEYMLHDGDAKDKVVEGPKANLTFRARFGSGFSHILCKLVSHVGDDDDVGVDDDDGDDSDSHDEIDIAHETVRHHP